MAITTNNPAPHAGEREAPGIPKSGQTPGMGRPSKDEDREPGTRPDGEASTPDTIDPEPDGKPKPNTDATRF
jgi:hypothetical protein